MSQSSHGGALAGWSAGAWRRVLWCAVPAAVVLAVGCGVPKEMYMDVQHENEALLSENLELKESRDTLQKQVTELSGTVSSAAEEKASLEARVERLIAEQHALSGERDQFKTQAMQLEQQVKQALTENEQLKGRVDSLNAIVQALKNGTPVEPGKRR